MIAGRWVPASLALVLTACMQQTPPRTGGGFGQTVQICRAGEDCRVVPTEQLRNTTLPVDGRGERQADPDLYRGENPAELQQAAREGDARAAYRMGQVLEFGLGGRGRNPAEAMRWYEQAAEANHHWAQFRLAQMLESGRRDRGRAVRLTVAAAEGGVAQAAYNLGMMHRSGQGVARDAGEAARWLTVAAENGVPEAQYNLGLMYFRGDGVPRQLYDALSWMRQAAQGGYLPAQKAVGRLYMTGLDTMGQDLTEARSWLSLAASRGDREAQGWLRQLDREVREERAFQRELQLQAAETQALWASIALAAFLAPPPVIVYSRRW
ncbi:MULTISPECIES: tetratricopeptide repeat protein [Roseomonadaceae]|uniref:Sel1 repeat family protein n=1 Tax=Falsiroseomonas oleicola TaxID=2801474 RepID=A0ABS6HED2_9PROT|nr:tetratricopeptide repeat protein [Roseomonas oleicola]MBU8547085.1 sel1 repeat family protein [Roseomonas oleicola]